ncbi:hypothetical protein [Agarivorans albus]|uniref:Uncharacterized protein n=1 Tax=Agarivorans albus MKT 106 TaxID=1331007 RepID=R9PQH0_AGAAL|nr:hypothetical protein [Agarivorans albus]GAD03599.1 hypothetical protein AALB_3679 [Agarivorans albus MKT 106]
MTKLQIGCISVGVVLSCFSFANDEDVITSTANGKSYYHMKVSLDEQSISSIKEFNEDQFVMNGGQFEVKV